MTRAAGADVTNPLDELAVDRSRARAQRDPWADLCVLGTVDEGLPQSRVLVLRDLDHRLAVFINATSPKHQQLVHGQGVSVLTYLASCGVQYRMAVTISRVPEDLVHESWRARPQIPKVMDWLYERHTAQSAVVASTATLQSLHDTVAATLGDDPIAPAGAIGFFLTPHQIERLQLASDRLHERTRFTLRSGAWHREVLVP